MASRLCTTVVCALLLALAAEASREHPFRLPSETTGDSSVVKSAQSATLVSHGRQLKQTAVTECPECRCIPSFTDQEAARTPTCVACFREDADGMKCWDIDMLTAGDEPIIRGGKLVAVKNGNTITPVYDDIYPECKQCLVIFH